MGTAVYEQPVLDGWCQRWNNRVDSWQNTTNDFFEPHRYQVKPIGETPARVFTTTHHYSKAWPAAQLRYGLIEDGFHLVGTCVLGVPMNPAVLTGPFPAFEPYRQSMEMSRLVLLDRIAANAESWFVARVFRAAAAQGVRGVVAYSDPVPRRVGGRILMPGHFGIVNQALGGIFYGPGRARFLTTLPDGSVLPERTLSKIRGEEQGAAGAIARLVAMGAPPKPDDQPGQEWLPIALDAVGAYWVDHPGNYRYAWSIGPRWSRRAYPVAMPSLPYPKPPLLIGAAA